MLLRKIYQVGYRPTNRLFATFPPSYIHPIFRHADQVALQEANDFERHTFLPVRPANSSQTSSVFYDPLVAKFTNHIMRKGNKILARGLLENHLFGLVLIKCLGIRQTTITQNDDSDWIASLFLKKNWNKDAIQSESSFDAMVAWRIQRHLINTSLKKCWTSSKKNVFRTQTFMEIKRVQLAKYATNPNVELNPYKLLHQAVANSRPFLQTTPIKRGGHTYQVPIPIRPNASLAIALEWLINAGKEKDDDTRFWKQLAKEIIDAAEGVGKVIKRKQDLHRVCEANRAYAHYRWG
ncbi:hypothetical protein Fcan01_18862 [Folsomia candida]|uniref:Small ribosomal subunit protein uS7 domain-containing protein n=1 Tax=Folsomia candida TaxID=158441 RepID=A0A226DME8_FOLCA|nr:hypothetical protein Fcan01_18862 [Folsomia candida]